MCMIQQAAILIVLNLGKHSYIIVHVYQCCTYAQHNMYKQANSSSYMAQELTPKLQDLADHDYDLDFQSDTGLIIAKNVDLEIFSDILNSIP